MNSMNILFLCILGLEWCMSFKMLFAPFPFPSHIGDGLPIIDELHKNGHEMHILLPNSYPDKSFKESRPNMTIIEYHAKHKDMYMLPKQSNPLSLIGVPMVQHLRKNADGLKEFCYNALEDDTLLQRLNAEKYDLVITGAFPVIRCYLILWYRLGVPYVSLANVYEAWLQRAPALPSFVPFFMSYPPKTPEMTFMERVGNLYSLVDWIVFPSVPYLSDDLVTHYAPEKAPVSINTLAGKSLLWLVLTDNTVDYPRPLMPNEVHIGGLSAKPSSPLTGDILSIVTKATRGVIIGSFGSLDLLNEELLGKFFQAFLQLPYTVIMRYSKELSDDIQVPENVNLVKWVPQNDLLGHEKVLLFIGHGGANSRFEALFHAVPMILFPLFGDHPYNSKCSEYMGYSASMDISTFTPDELVTNINKIIPSDSSYRENIERSSAIFRSRPMEPRQRAAFWVEHVAKFGGKHLRSHGLDIPWYQYGMLDILGAALLLVGFLGSLIWMCVKCATGLQKSALVRQKKD